MGALGPEQLKIIHYYYFFISVFSILNAFILWFVSTERNIGFFTFCGLNFSISIYTTWVSLKEMQKLLVIRYIKYIFYHFALIILAAIVTFVVWLIFSGVETILYNGFLLVNLIVFIIGFFIYINNKFLKFIIYYYKKFYFSHSKAVLEGEKRKPMKQKLEDYLICYIQKLRFLFAHSSGEEARTKLENIKASVSKPRKEINRDIVVVSEIKDLEEYKKLKKMLAKKKRKR